MDPCAHAIMGELRDLMRTEEGGRLGAWDTEPKYRILDALEAGKPVPPDGKDYWELFSTVKGVEVFDRLIAEKVNAIFAAAAPQHIDGEALGRMWRKVWRF
jgi:hypothetical protein